MSSIVDGLHLARDIDVGWFVRSPIASECLQHFLTNISWFMPIVDPISAEALMQHAAVGHESGAQATLLALSSYVLAQPGVLFFPRAYDILNAPCRSSRDFACTLLRQAYQMVCDGNATSGGYGRHTWTLNTLFLMVGASRALGDRLALEKTIRQAGSMANQLSLHMMDELDCTNADSREARLYWLLLIEERLHAVSRPFAVMLRADKQLPMLGSDLRLNWLTYMACLVIPLEGMVGCHQDPRTSHSIDFMGIQRDISEALQDPILCNEAQIVDLRCCKAWIQSMLWQCSLASGSSADYAIELPIRALRETVLTIRRHNFHTKLEQVPCCHARLCDLVLNMIDVMYSGLGEEYVANDPEDYVIELTSIITSTPTGLKLCVPLIATKLRSLRFMPGAESTERLAWRAQKRRLCTLLNHRSSLLALHTLLSPQVVYSADRPTISEAVGFTSAGFV